ncbi:antibiotic biosynthesis monooxygenase family protein [Rubrivivax sp. RP6-9]|uniref:antibiotic biosynthesis monooxygenase family protein n=1 Tax=Rubrivivax sp. RP6-9 TaxID=3415750 RepID=UPI003CC64472
MILTVFRSRLNEGHRAEYDRHVQATAALAEQMPGFLGHKMFVADDGERVTLVEFDSMDHQRAWSLSPEHKAAAIAGRRGFYAEYRIQICRVERDARFQAKAGAEGGMVGATGAPAAGPAELAVTARP